MKISFLVLAAVLGLAPAARAATLYSCPGNGTANGWDYIDRGFYVTDYPGTTLDSVTLIYHGPAGDGSYTIALTAHLNSYDGAVIGSTQQQTASLSENSATPVTFHFGNAAVSPGSTIAFTQSTVSGPGEVAYDYGLTTPTCAGVFETEGTAPPLDTIRRNTVGLTITGDAQTTAPSGVSATAPALALPGILLMFGGLLGVAFLRLKSQRANTRR
ncbi:MAG: hypothetical protein QM741_11795 [Rudaea sp.]|uniref:hypothetical protein n=1 Tax=Rudaea sp. TaxID=2136325 RepID=UPI0039E3D2AF